MPVAEQSVRQVGKQLFSALFNESVYGTYRASLGVAQQRAKRLRVVLRLTAPELATLPWETLFDPETETYLCRQEPLIRHVPAPYTPDPLEVRLPLRILGLIASPRGYPPLDVEAEQRHLSEALAEPIAAGLVELIWVPHATWDKVHAQLLAGEWHVLHFVGHGDYVPGSDEGVLALVGTDGRTDLVEASRLSDLLSEAQPAPRLVVLNSCSSGKAGARDLFSGTAAALVHSGISAVAAMQFTVSDNAAIAFARGFYTSIAHGRGIDEAARSGRISILGTPGTLEWVTPVLYLRGEATQLFALTKPVARPVTRLETPPENRRRSRDRPAVTDDVEKFSNWDETQQHALWAKAHSESRLEHYDNAISLLDDLLALDPRYSGAVDMRDSMRRNKRLTDTYLNAREAEDAGDSTTAAGGYAEILQDDPRYRDVADRKERCDTQNRIANLRAELRTQANAGRWQAVIDVDAKLGQLDPWSSDLDRLATHARQKLANKARQNLPAEPLRTIVTSTPVQDACWHPDGARIAVATLGAWTSVYTVEDSKKMLEFEAGDLTSSVLAVAFDSDGTWLATGNDGGSAQIWDADSGSWLLEVCHRGRVLSVVFSQDGTRVATGSSDGTARVWEVASGSQLLKVHQSETVRSVALSPEGLRLATGSSDGTARVWDAEYGGSNLLELYHGTDVFSVAFSPDGTRLVTGSSDETARIWDIGSGSNLLEVRHGAEVFSVAFSPDGTRLATGSSDQTACVWDACSGSKLLEVSHGAEVFSVAFSPDGTRLVTGGGNECRIWLVSKSSLTATCGRH
jgi:WD40 repeat protein